MTERTFGWSIRENAPAATVRAPEPREGVRAMNHGTPCDAVRMTPMLSVHQFAEALGVSDMTIYRALKAGQIPSAIRVRRQWRIPSNATVVSDDRRPATGE